VVPWWLSHDDWTRPLTGILTSIESYSQEREYEEGNAVDDASLPVVGEVVEVEDDGDDDVEQDRVEEQARNKLLLPLLVLAPERVQLRDFLGGENNTNIIKYYLYSDIELIY
jgi:hypothetical protein